MAGVPFGGAVHEGGAAEMGWGEGERSLRCGPAVSGGGGKLSLRVVSVSMCDH